MDNPEFCVGKQKRQYFYYPCAIRKLTDNYLMQNFISLPGTMR